MDTGSLVSWLTLLLLVVNAVLVWMYLQETKKIRIASEAQIEGQIRPAIVVRVDPPNNLKLFNVGQGPALHVKLSATQRGSVGVQGLDRIGADDIWIVEARGPGAPAGVRTLPLSGPACSNDLCGRSLQCEYKSLSGRTHWTVVDFDESSNTSVTSTRFNSSAS